MGPFLAMGPTSLPGCVGGRQGRSEDWGERGQGLAGLQQLGQRIGLQTLLEWLEPSPDGFLLRVRAHSRTEFWGPGSPGVGALDKKDQAWQGGVIGRRCFQLERSRLDGRKGYWVPQGKRRKGYINLLVLGILHIYHSASGPLHCSLVSPQILPI